jgi:3-phenylpropionate/trans-cinnamate dioxygenase ferredoxin subunit
MTRYIVAAAAEIPPGARKLVEVAGRSIGVFNIGGEFFALKNTCPHQGGPLCEGPLGSWIESRAPGDYTLRRPGEMLRCPWHGWEFDVRTGQSWWNPRRARVKVYPVAVESGLDPASDHWQKGPYVAETYPVDVEQPYLVIELNA